MSGNNKTAPRHKKGGNDTFLPPSLQQGTLFHHRISSTIPPSQHFNGGRYTYPLRETSYADITLGCKLPGTNTYLDGNLLSIHGIKEIRLKYERDFEALKLGFEKDIAEEIRQYDDAGWELECQYDQRSDEISAKQSDDMELLQIRDLSTPETQEEIEALRLIRLRHDKLQREASDSFISDSKTLDDMHQKERDRMSLEHEREKTKLHSDTLHAIKACIAKRPMPAWGSGKIRQ